MGNSIMKKLLLKDMVRVLTLPLRVLPIRSNRILFTGLTGGSGCDYACNPKYLYEYMRKHDGGAYEYVWAVHDPDRYRFLEDTGVKLVAHFHLSSFPALMTAKVIVTNGSYAPWFPFRRGQYVINTWHGGGAYKKVEMETEKNNASARRMAAFCARNIDLFIASCRVQEQQMIRTSYGYGGEVLRCGTPRNDRLVAGETLEMASRVRECYGIDEMTGIVLYAPTYRYGTVPVTLQADDLAAQLFKTTGRKWVVLGRYHRYQTEGMRIRVEGRDVLNVADYPDMQELLAAADVMITDYSSCVWDYAFLNRPCVLYVPDAEEYKANTGFYTPLDDWPFPQAYTQDELVRKTEELLTDAQCMETYARRVKAHLQDLGCYEDGHAAQRIAERIASVTAASDKTGGTAS